MVKKSIGRVKAYVEFTFDTKGDEKGIKEAIDEQIVTDLNQYYQSDDERAQMVNISIKKLKRVW